MKNLYILLLLFCTLSAFTHIKSSESKETEVAYKYRVSLPDFMIKGNILGNWNDRTSTPIELHVKRNINNENIIDLKFTTWRLFQAMRITWWDSLLDKLEPENEFYPEYVRDTGIDINYHRILWKKLCGKGFLELLKFYDNFKPFGSRRS